MATSPRWSQRARHQGAKAMKMIPTLKGLPSLRTTTSMSLMFLMRLCQSLAKITRGPTHTPSTWSEELPLNIHNYIYTLLNLFVENKTAMNTFSWMHPLCNRLRPLKFCARSGPLWSSERCQVLPSLTKAKWPGASFPLQRMHGWKLRIGLGLVGRESTYGLVQLVGCFDFGNKRNVDMIWPWKLQVTLRSDHEGNAWVALRFSGFS